MKTIHRYLISVAAITATLEPVAAASSEMHTIEKRVVAANGTGVRMPAEPREPVTYLGVIVTPVEAVLASQLQLAEGQGLVVSFVEPDGPAAQAGLRQHDVLTKLDDQILIEPRQLSVLVQSHHEGDTVEITYLRAGQQEKAGVMLAQHVPAEPNALQWFGQGMPGIVYRAENFGSPADIDVHRIQRAPNGDFTIPLSPALNVLRRSGMSDDRVMIFRPQTNVVLSDETGTLILSTDGGERVLKAEDAAGNVVFDGPIDTPEQREQLSDELRKRLEKLERLDVMDASPQPVRPAVPRPPRASGFTPAAPPAHTGAVL